MGKWLKKFEEINHYETFRESDDYLLPNVSWITSSDEVMYNPDVKEIGPKVTLRYRSTADNLLAFSNGGNNIKSLKVDGKNIEFEPLVIGLNEVEILNSEVKINYEAESEYEMFDFPDSYVITSLPSSIVVKPKDSNVKIGDIGNMILFAIIPGMKMSQPIPFEGLNGMFVIDEENNQLVCTEEFLAEFEMIISYGYGYGFGLCTVNEETGEFTVVDSLLIYEGISGGLKTPYYFDKEGEHIVEMELMSGDFGGMYMFYDMATEISAPLISVVFNEKITSIGQYTFCYNTLLTEITCESIIAPTLYHSFVGDVAYYGTLNYPEGSDYSSWLSIEEGCLGYYGWNSEPMFMTGTFTVTNSGQGYQLYNNGNNILGAQIDGVWVDGYHTFDKEGVYTVKYALRDVTTIDDKAFYGCSGLTSVEIGSECTTIGNSAFTYCYGLTSVVIPDSVTTIGDSAFQECSYLTSVEIGSGVTSIGYSAFSGCGRLTSVVIPDSVAFIGSGAFGNCIGLTGELIIPDSVTTIGIRAFSDCQGLTSLEIGSGCISIGDYAFDNCWGLSNIVCHAVTAPTIQSYTFHRVSKGGILTYPEGSDYSSWLSTDSYYLGYYEWNKVLSEITTVYNVTGTTSATKLLRTTTDIVEMVVDGVKLDSVVTGYTFDSVGEHTVVYKMYDIPYQAFSGCTSLTSVVIPDSVTSIGNDAFSNCYGLTSVVIPDSVTNIGNYAFSNCRGLTGELIIPDSVTFIGSQAFYSCSGLTSVEIGSGVTSIGNSAFYGCSGLESIVVEEGNTVYDSRENCNCLIETSTNTLIKGCNSSFIPDSVTSIGDSAFSSCRSLTGELIIPDSVTSIGDSAFSGCTSLTGELVIPDSVTTIGKFAFYYCSGLASVEIGSGVTSIGDYAFSRCSGLTGELVIPNSVTEIGGETFRNCSGLASVEIGSGVTTIGDYAFSNCIGLTGELIIPDSVTSIGRTVFETCYGLTSVEIGSGVTSIGYSAFSRCSGLTGELVIPDSVTSIGDYAFSGCTSLTSVEIGSGVTTIGDYAFSGCTSLTGELVIPDSVTSIGDYAFSRCSGLASVEIGSGVTSIGNSAFYGCSGLTSVVIPDSVTTIGKFAFYYCSGLASVEIGSGVTSIGDYAFYICTDLTEIVCYAPIAPTTQSNTFNSIKSNGVLKVPVGSDYSTWMNYLGSYNWTIEYI